MNNQKIYSQNDDVIDEDDVIPEEITEQIIRALHAEAEADDFDEEIEPVTDEELAAGQAAWATYRGASDVPDGETPAA